MKPEPCPIDGWRKERWGNASEEQLDGALHQDDVPTPVENKGRVGLVRGEDQQ
jgi:hypothetical protein